MVHDANDTHASEYKCVCDEYWMGPACDKEEDMTIEFIHDWAKKHGHDPNKFIAAEKHRLQTAAGCVENICMNGATCVPEEFCYHCVCSPRFIGDHC
jgi:hypothetical protein